MSTKCQSLRDFKTSNFKNNVNLDVQECGARLPWRPPDLHFHRRTEVLLQRRKTGRRGAASQPWFARLYLRRSCPSQDPACTWYGFHYCKEIYRICSGAMHEHMRPDRDLFVSINYENIQPQATSNFAMVHSSSQSFGNTPFDTSSVMMYGPHDFGIIDSSGRPKITVQPLKAGVDMRS